MDAANAQVTGSIGLNLYKGSARVVTRSSPNAVYDAQLASFAESGGLFSQAASPGFIELWSLQSRMAHRIRRRGVGGGLMYDLIGRLVVKARVFYVRRRYSRPDHDRGRRRSRSRSAGLSPTSRDQRSARGLKPGPQDPLRLIVDL